MAKLPYGTTVGDYYEVLHAGNHNEEFNPHWQYLLASNIVVLTQAQYNALSSSKTSDGVLYFIKA